jgi:hypothetical protein
VPSKIKSVLDDLKVYYSKRNEYKFWRNDEKNSISSVVKDYSNVSSLYEKKVYFYFENSSEIVNEFSSDLLNLVFTDNSKDFDELLFKLKTLKKKINLLTWAKSWF